MTTGKLMKARHAALFLLLVGPTLAMCDAAPTALRSDRSTPGSDPLVMASIGSAASRTISVSGSAVHYLTTAAIHSQQPTAVGMIQRSTEIIRLTGDLDGYILYHPTSTFDFANGTLVNTGTQLFSGTIAGSEPVVLHDDDFRFEVDLATGATLGSVRLARSNDAPHKGTWYECDLTVVGTGQTPEGDVLADYDGICLHRGSW
jgi:hypothetical protein